MAVVLIVPHVLVVYNLAFPIQRQRHQTVDRLRKMCYARSVLLLHLEDELRISAGDDLGGKGLGGSHDFRYT